MLVGGRERKSHVCQAPATASSEPGKSAMPLLHRVLTGCNPPGARRFWWRFCLGTPEGVCAGHADRSDSVFDKQHRHRSLLRVGSALNVDATLLLNGPSDAQAGINVPLETGHSYQFYLFGPTRLHWLQRLEPVLRREQFYPGHLGIRHNQQL
jgi:hypothetical protein